MHKVDPTAIPAHREIVTDYFPPNGGTVRAIDVVPGDGDIHRAGSVADAVAQSKAEWQALDVKIQELHDTIGWAAMDDLLSRVAALQNAVRRESIARLIAAAVATVDYPIDLFVVVGTNDSACNNGGGEA